MERVRALTLLKPEPSTEGAVGSHGSAGSSWPYEGKIEFTHVSATYAADGDLVLKDVSFRIAAGQRVGVVGRTGAGKSSLTLVRGFTHSGACHLTTATGSLQSD